VNILWALVNIVVGCYLFRVGKVASCDLTRVVFFAGIVVMSVMLSVNFAKKHSDQADLER
jgi:hypothetical protein